jgi:Na+/citrate or Na+/malate symporter
MAFEIKLGTLEEEKAAKNLLNFAKKISNSANESGEYFSKPILLAIVVGIGSFYHKRDDCVTIIPFDCLG